MILDRNSTNRCILFLYYDKDGSVDRYVTGLLDALKKVSSYLLVVVNGYITQEAESELKRFSDSVHVRVNTGFDLGGYREGLFWIGFERLGQYDELVLMNYTFFAPLFSLEEMFREMNTRDVDFWGITKHHDVPSDTTGGRIRYGHIPEHLNSHFLALRRDFFLSCSYMDFIINMTNPISYEASINDYEAIFTKHFEDLGYKWDVYTDTNEFEGVVYAPFMFEGAELIKKRCPIIKRRVFFGDYFSLLANSAGESYSDAYRAVRDLTDYDCSLIWENILRLQDRNAVRYAIHEYFIADSEFSENRPDGGRNVILVIGSEQKADFLAGRYLRQVPEGCDVLYSGNFAGSFEELQALAEVIKDCSRVCVIMLPENYRDDTGSLFYGDCESLIGSGHQIENIIEIFSSYPEIGLLVPPLPTYGSHFAKAEDGWYGRYDEIRKMTETMGLTFPVLRGELPPVHAKGGSFWSRGNVLADILRDERIRDALSGELCAPAEQSAADFELFMLLLPYLYQEKGYMTGTVTGTHYAAVLMTNLDYELRENNRILFDKTDPGPWWKVLDRLSKIRN